MIKHTRSVSILLLIILLSSCSHVVKKDGPPNYYIDETRIPNAVPKCEPLAKYGNMRSYTVFGKRYYVMKAHHNYEEKGIASWYGTQFHARRTSSGERYNMLAMTAAHKTLPLPTYVEVTNLRNNRKIIVKVNDRGPFASNRIIDLSYVAAKKLGMLGHGTAPVKIKTIDPNTYGRSWMMAKRASGSSCATKRNHNQPSHFAPVVAIENDKMLPVYLQVGAFRDRLNAIKLKNRLVTLLEAPIKIYSPTTNTRLYRVQVGPIKDMAAREEITHRLRGLGIKPM